MPTLLDADLLDPAPPVPGDKQRAAVATRAHQLGRRRRVLQGAGALGMVAVVAVGVAALTADGTSGPARSGGIEAAGSPDAVPPAPAAPTPASGLTVSGTVSNIPSGVTLTLTLGGNGGTFSAIADGAGNFSITGLPAGTYDASYAWSNPAGTASQVGKLGAVTVSGNATVSLALP